MPKYTVEGYDPATGLLHSEVVDAQNAGEAVSMSWFEVELVEVAREAKVARSSACAQSWFSRNKTLALVLGIPVFAALGFFALMLALTLYVLWAGGDSGIQAKSNPRQVVGQESLQLFPGPSASQNLDLEGHLEIPDISHNDAMELLRMLESKGALTGIGSGDYRFPRSTWRRLSWDEKKRIISACQVNSMFRHDTKKLEINATEDGLLLAETFDDGNDVGFIHH